MPGAVTVPLREGAQPHVHDWWRASGDGHRVTGYLFSPTEYPEGTSLEEVFSRTVGLVMKLRSIIISLRSLQWVPYYSP